MLLSFLLLKRLSVLEDVVNCPCLIHSSGVACNSLETGKLLQGHSVRVGDVASSQCPSSSPARAGTAWWHAVQGGQREDGDAPSAAPLGELHAPRPLLRRTVKAPQGSR